MSHMTQCDSCANTPPFSSKFNFYRTSTITLFLNWQSIFFFFFISCSSAVDFETHFRLWSRRRASLSSGV